MNKIKWGILSTANIGIKKVIPAMQQGEYCEINAIASQNIEKAESAAAQLNIPKAYGSYESLLADKEIDAVYIPLPNHLHVDYSIKALEAGKHVLCEKPLSLNVKEAEKLLEITKANPDLKFMEAFMYRFHPQWNKTKELIEEGKIGKVRTVNSFFSYTNLDPNNIRNKPEIGGGGLMDIGCYCISFARYIFNDEPIRVIGHMEFDPEMKTDRLTSGLMQFREGTSTFTCSTQLYPYQRINIFGTKGRIEIEIPVNAPNDRKARIYLDTEGKNKEITFEACDQYTLQGDAFSKSIINKSDVPTPIEDGINNMKVLESIVNSGRTGQWAEMKN